MLILSILQCLHLLGTSQPATEVMVETFKGTPYDTGFDQQLLSEITDCSVNA